MKKDVHDNLIDFLQTISYLKGQPLPIIKKLAKAFESHFILSGDILLNQGDAGDCLYIVQSGRLITLKNDANGSTEVLGDIRQGEFIGELALFTEAPRFATVIAVRDSVLWKLSKESFDKFVEKNPAYIMPIVKSAMLRLLNPSKQRAKEFTSIALVPAGQGPLDKEFVHNLVAEFNRKKTALHLNQTVLQKQFPEIDVENFDKNIEIANWLNLQESLFSYVIYEVQEPDSGWTKLCIRQADKIILMADAQNPIALNSIEKTLFNTTKIIPQHIAFTLLHDPDTILPKKTDQWLKERPVELYNIRKNNPKDIQRLTRLITGNEIALVLGGGGVKSVAQAGVYKALVELNIPIDRICGTSMGGLIAGYFAMDHSAEEFTRQFEAISAKGSHDYTLPIVALMKGERWLDIVKETYGDDVLIEDLWKNFFCIASNITLHQTEVLNKGLLYKAVRASVSLPGIMPPISNENNELYVDGGIVNNLPVDIMRQLSQSANIIAVRVSPFSRQYATISDGVVSGFNQLFNRFKKKKTRSPSAIPGIGEIIATSVMLSNEKNEKQIIKQANHSLVLDLKQFSMLEFDKYQQLIDLGYSEAMDYFSQNPIIV